jgi:hypothetical protein
MKINQDCIHYYHNTNVSSFEDENKLKEFHKSKIFIKMAFDMCIQFLSIEEIPYYKLNILINLLNDFNKLYELKSLTQIKLYLNIVKDKYKYESDNIIVHGNEKICKYINSLTECINALCNLV